MGGLFSRAVEYGELPHRQMEGQRENPAQPSQGLLMRIRDCAANFFESLGGSGGTSFFAFGMAWISGKCLSTYSSPLLSALSIFPMVSGTSFALIPLIRNREENDSFIRIATVITFNVCSAVAGFALGYTPQCPQEST